jgi:hypothetical protein
MITKTLFLAKDALLFTDTLAHLHGLPSTTHWWAMPVRTTASHWASN